MIHRQESAQDLAMSALLYLVGQPDLLAGFLRESGIRPDALRRAAERPELALHVLDYLLENDRRAQDAALAMQIPPADLMRARTVLGGPGSHGWEV